MRAYIDHVLAVFPFEPAVVGELGGPPLTYVGHRLMGDPGLLAARKAQLARRSSSDTIDARPVCLLLPGSRRSEISRLAGDIGRSAKELSGFFNDIRFVMPVAEGREDQVREAISDWEVDVELVNGEAGKWAAFAQADVAIAASGTVLLELALAGVPAISLYRVDFIAVWLLHLVYTWSAALPNLIADRVVTQEYFQNLIRPARIGRLARQLVADPLTRTAALADLDRVFDRMAVARPPEDNAAEIVLGLLQTPKK